MERHNGQIAMVQPRNLENNNTPLFAQPQQKQQQQQRQLLQQQPQAVTSSSLYSNTVLDSNNTNTIPLQYPYYNHNDYPYEKNSHSDEFYSSRPSCCTSCFQFYNNDMDNVTLEGNAFDVIMVQSEDKKLFQNSEFLVTFSTRSNNRKHKMILEIQGDATTCENCTAKDTSNETTTPEGAKGRKTKTARTTMPSSLCNNCTNNCTTAWFPITRLKETIEESESSEHDDDYYSWGCCHHPMTTTATPGRISDLNGTIEENEIASKLAPFLKPGKNPIRYLLLDHERVIGIAHANIFLWSHKDRVVVSDIDGTITKSNARGVVDTIFTEKYKYCHDGVCKLLSWLVHQQSNTQIVYLTSRPIGLASATRKFLSKVTQESIPLPEGPLLGFGGNLPQLVVMELLSMNTHHFKSSVLWNQVVQPFRRVEAYTNNLSSSSLLSSSSSPIFVAGFGNSIMDVQAYHMAGIDLEKIYLINKKSKLFVFDRHKEDDKEVQIYHRIKRMKNKLATMMTHQHQQNHLHQQQQQAANNTSIGIPMSRSWYKTRMGTTFDGYTDHSLSTHVMVMPQQHQQDQQHHEHGQKEEDSHNHHHQIQAVLA